MAPPSDRRQARPRHRSPSPLFFNPNCHYYRSPSPSSSSSSPPPPPPEELRNIILNQIEYYFSDNNLAMDVYLRKYMDDNGWVPLTFIANFPRIESLTKDIGLILFTLNSSSQTVEVEGKKVRRRTSWNKWILDATMRKQQRWAVEDL